MGWAHPQEGLLEEGLDHQRVSLGLHEEQHMRGGGRQAGGTQVWAVVWATETKVGYRVTSGDAGSITPVKR